MEKETNSMVPDWAMGMNCAVTVCDADGIIIYMNEKSRATYVKNGGAALIGKSLFDCHGERAAGIIRHLLATGEANSYTIEKEGLHKMIYQTPWRDAEGKISGLVEISMVIPAELPHFVRK